MNSFIIELGKYENFEDENMELNGGIDICA